MTSQAVFYYNTNDQTFSGGSSRGSQTGPTVTCTNTNSCTSHAYYTRVLFCYDVYSFSDYGYGVGSQNGLSVGGAYSTTTNGSSYHPPSGCPS